MTPEDALRVADEVLTVANGKPLTDVQRLILRESLAAKGYEEVQGYEAQHIKNEGSKLWRLLSAALGEKVSKTNFKGALEKRWQLGNFVPQPPVPSTYNPQTWVARKANIDNLLPKLQEQTRILWITGISGIGKTTLGECLASQAWEKDPSFQWIYLEILAGQSPDFASIAVDLLVKLGDREPDPQERNNSDLLARRLLQKLAAHRYWIQIDTLEHLLDPKQTNEFIDPYWTTFLQRCLNEASIVSRLVLTSQAFPSSLVEFDTRYSNVWTEIRLGGLSQSEQQLEFFAKRGVNVELSNQDILSRIAAIYEGHPLVLQVIAEDMLNRFGGDVCEYWQAYQPEFEQVARELQVTRLNELEYNEALDRKVRDRIEKTLKQLPDDALDLLCRSAVFRRPVPKQFWWAMLDDRTPQQQKAAYRILDDRALVEKEPKQTLIRQHNLIRSVAYDLLRTDAFTWEAAERKAAELWLNSYKPILAASNLEKMRGELEAFHHCFEVGDYQYACDIVSSQVNFKTISLYQQLSIWGYFKELLPISQTFLEIARKTKNREAECDALTSLGEVYRHLGHYSVAINYHQESLYIASEIGGHRLKAGIHNNLGIAHTLLGEYDQAIYFLKQAREISQQIPDRQLEGKTLCNLGLAYYKRGDYSEAAKTHEQHLAAARAIHDSSEISYALGNLGAALIMLEQYPEALEKLEQALVSYQQDEDREAEAEAYKHLAELHQKTGSLDLAQDYCNQALKIAIELGIPLAKECEVLKQKLEEEHNDNNC